MMVNRQHVIDAVKKIIRGSCKGVACPATRYSTVGVRVQSNLNSLVAQGVIGGYVVETSLLPKEPFVHVDDLPKGAMPGDAVITKDDVSDRYGGLVVSSDRNGHGVVFRGDAQGDSHTIHVKCNVQLNHTLEYVVIEAIVESDSSSV